MRTAVGGQFVHRAAQLRHRTLLAHSLLKNTRQLLLV